MSYGLGICMILKNPLNSETKYFKMGRTSFVVVFLKSGINTNLTQNIVKLYPTLTQIHITKDCKTSVGFKGAQNCHELPG